jgi:two-component system sensor kinase FixL
VLAHELNQPLMSVATAARAGVRLLNQEQADRTELVEALEMAAIQAEQAAFVIRALRQLAVGKKPARVLVELEPLVKESLQRSPAPVEGSSLELVIPAHFPKILVDPAQFGLALVNLIKNCFEAMQDVAPDARRLLIEASHDDRHVQITLRDAGPGFPGGATERWLGPFQSSKREGMGIGLTLSHWIVQAHGGQLTIPTSSPQGTVFQISLPLGEESHEHEKPTA